MKSKEELNELKKEGEAVNEKLAELTEEEIAQVNGGAEEALRKAEKAFTSAVVVGSQCN